MQLEEAQGKLQNRWIDLDHFRSAFLLKTTFFFQDLRFGPTFIHNNSRMAHLIAGLYSPSQKVKKTIPPIPTMF